MPMCNLSCHILVLPFAICHRKKQARRKFSTYPLGFCRIFTYICISGRSLAKRETLAFSEESLFPAFPFSCFLKKM